jgi:hypothetical protein
MSRRFRIKFALIALLVGLASGTSFGQLGSNVPVVSGVFPPGATIGQTTEWTISGRNLSKVGSLRISGGGVEVLELKIKDETSATAKVGVAPDALPGLREVRLDGASGVSNLAIIRIDRLKQVLEVESNDTLELAQEVEVGSAVIGVLQTLDVDCFRLKGRPGQRVTLDLEARRVGTSIAPVLTVFSAAGVAIAQGRRFATTFTVATTWRNIGFASTPLRSPPACSRSAARRGRRSRSKSQAGTSSRLFASRSPSPIPRARSCRPAISKDPKARSSARLV